MSKPNRYKGLRPNPHTLGVEPLPEGWVRTKVYRFRLPAEYATALEKLETAERNKLMLDALKRLEEEEQ